MLRLRLLPVFVALAFAACSQSDSALRIDVTVDQTTPFATDCLRLTVLGADGKALTDGTATFVKPANDKAVAVIRRQSAWPQQVTLRVEGLVGPPLSSSLTTQERPAAEKARCADAASLRLNARVEKDSQSFPSSGITDVALVLARDSFKDKDTDKDGFASMVDGDATRADCDDSAVNTHYGQSQLCTTTADTDCNDLPGCDDPVCFGIGLCNAPPTRLVLVDGGMTDLSLPQPSYTLIPLVYELRNASGVTRQAIRDTPVTVTADNANIEFVGAQADGGFLIPVNATQVLVGVRTRVSLLQQVNLHLSALVNAAPDAGLATADTALLFKPADVARLAFIDAGVIAIPAATCSTQELRLQLQDSMNRPTIAPTSGLMVSFAVPGTINGGALFDDTCTVPLTQKNFTAGESEVSMHLKYDTFGSYQVEASAGGVPTATYPFQVNAGGPAKLGFFSTGGAVTTLALDTGACSVDGQVFVRLLDAQGNPTTSPTDTPLTLTLSNNAPADLRFFTSACTAGTDTFSFVLPANAASLPLHVRGTMATMGDVTATMSTSVSGITSTAMNVSIGAGPASTVEIAGTAQTITAGSCSTSPFTVRLKDANGNSVGSDAGVRVTISTEADLTFFTDGGCSTTGVNYVDLAPGAPEQLFTFRGTAARPALTIGPAVLSVPLLSNYTGGVANNVILPGAASKVEVTPPSRTIVAGSGCANYTVTVKDQYGNATPYGLGGPAGGSIARSLVVAPSSLTVSDDIACSTGNGATLPAGSATVPLSLSTTVAATYMPTVAPQGLGLTSDPVTLIVNPGAGSLVFRDAGAPWVVTAGDCRSALISSEDQYGNPVAASSIIAVDGGDGTWLFTDSNCTNAVSGGITSISGTSVLLGIKPTKSGDKLVTAGAAPPLSLVVHPAATHHYAFEGNGPTLAAGDCAGPVSLARYDVWNNLADGGFESANLTSNPSRVSYYAGAGCSGAASTTTGINPGAARSNTFFIGATIAGNTTMVAASSVAQGDAGLVVTPDAGHHLAFTAQPGTTLTAGTCASFTVEQQDGFNNRVPSGAMVSLLSDALQGDGGTNVFFAAPAGTCTSAQNSLTLTAGTGVFNFRPEKAASVTVNATSGALLPATSSILVQPDVATVLAWQQLPAGAVQRFECADAGVAEARDQFGNVSAIPTGGQVAWASGGSLGASFFSDSDCTTSVTSVNIPTNGSSTAPVFMKAAGTSGTVRATATTTTALNGAQTPLQNVTATGGFGQFVMTPPTAFVEAFACVPYTVTRNDSSGVPVTYGTTSFSASVGAGLTLHSDPACSGLGAANQAFNIAPGTASQVIYVRGRSVDDLTNVTITANDTSGGFDAGTAIGGALPLVRRGSCDLDGGSEVRCQLSPAIPNNDISRSFVIFTSSGGDATATNANVACRLDNSGDASVVCTRAGNGSGDNGVTLDYQVVSFGRGYDAGGVSVQHFYDGGVPFTADVPYQWIPSLTDSFVLFSSWSVGTENGPDDFMTALLTASGGVRIQAGLDGGDKTYSLQVVSWNGAQVERGSTNISPANLTNTATTSLVGSNSTNSFVLFSVRGNDANPDAGYYQMCKRQVRATLSGSPVQIAFSRGNGDNTNCADDAVNIRWEVVMLPSTLGSVSAGSAISVAGNGSGGYLTSLAGGLNSSVVPNKAVIFAGGQGPGGQSMGESNFFQADTNGDQLGPFHAMLRWVGGSVNAVALCKNPGSGGKTSLFNPQLVQFNP